MRLVVDPPPIPEGVARAAVSQGPVPGQGYRFVYHGPMFRRERPQKGRFRQFTQVGVEHIGDDSAHALADAECIAMGRRCLEALGLGEDDVELRVHTLGDQASRAAYTEALTAYLEGARLVATLLAPKGTGLARLGCTTCVLALCARAQTIGATRLSQGDAAVCHWEAKSVSQMDTCFASWTPRTPPTRTCWTLLRCCWTLPPTSPSAGRCAAAAGYSCSEGFHSCRVGLFARTGLRQCIQGGCDAKPWLLPGPLYLLTATRRCNKGSQLWV